MHPVEKHLLETEFSGLAGTNIEGTIALSDELINLGLMEVLAKLKSATDGSAKTPAAAAADSDATDAGPALDPKSLLKKLNVETLRYRTENGRTLLDLNVNFG